MPRDVRSQVPKEDFTQRWEAFHWPLRLKLKVEETEKMLEEDRNLFQKEMTAQQQQVPHTARLARSGGLVAGEWWHGGVVVVEGWHALVHRVELTR